MTRRFPGRLSPEAAIDFPSSGSTRRLPREILTRGGNRFPYFLYDTVSLRRGCLQRQPSTALVLIRHGVPRSSHRLLGLPLRLHTADLARGGHTQLHGAGGRRVVVDTHLERAIESALVLAAIVVEEAREDERYGERESADAEEDEPDKLTHVQVEVEGDGAAVDHLDVVGDGADEDGPLRHEVADEDADDAEHEEVGADPHEHLPPDGGGGAPVAPGAVGRQQVAPGVVLVDVWVLVDVRLVEVVQVRLDAEVVGAASHAARRLGVARLALRLLVNLLHRRRSLEAFSLCRTNTRTRFLLLPTARRTLATALLTACDGRVAGQFHTTAYVARLVGHRGGSSGVVSSARLAIGQE